MWDYHLTNYHDLSDRLGYFLTSSRFSFDLLRACRLLKLVYSGSRMQCELVLRSWLTLRQSYSLNFCCCMRAWVSDSL